MEIGLVGDVDATLTALLPLLEKKADRDFLSIAQQRMPSRHIELAARMEALYQREAIGRRLEFDRLWLP